MFNISDSICDGADSANNAADSDGDNFMYERSGSETDCDWQIFREKDKMHAIGLNVRDRINSLTKLTLSMKFVLLLHAFRKYVSLGLRYSYF